MMGVFLYIVFYMAKNWKYLFLIVTGILLIPGIAMFFTDEVSWSFFDFLIAGFLLFGFGSLLIYISKKITSKKYRLLLMAAVLLLLLLVWIEMAVGIFGSPIAGS